MSNAEKAIVYASLILADDGLEINADNLQAITKAAGVTVDPIYFGLFAKALAGRDINEMLMNEESEEESDDDMGFGLFD
ncbi:hypothetical protein BB559_006003 [Furculomyces boomerangus]|uniref:60S acidic ribosomal protein P1 n=1 Tax=Furculomyces boomerangus TaxID=61424 RepID=A0A2T9Y581_9FUNG|nr:hypothetical protein BB559_006643 [Furculomyces boomerangus]PVU87509.1 hypothetical protein BB559_006003 [Furculomyces boomerangus]